MTKEADDAITRGTGIRRSRPCRRRGAADLRLAQAINGVTARRRLSQAAAEKLRINQPKVSALANYKLDGFSVERLTTFLTALGQRRGDRDQEQAAVANGRADFGGGGPTACERVPIALYSNNFAISAIGRNNFIG
jgi:hypothetical protein